MLQAYTDVSRIIDCLIVKVAVNVSAKSPDTIWMDRYMGENDFVAVMILLDYIRSDVIKPRYIVLELEDIMVTLN